MIYDYTLFNKRFCIARQSKAYYTIKAKRLKVVLPELVSNANVASEATTSLFCEATMSANDVINNDATTVAVAEITMMTSR